MTEITTNSPFLKALLEKPLLADGGVGTLLYMRGASTEAAFEQLNLTKPELVQQVHIDYLNAGSDLIETNSFSGNRLRLASYGLEDQVWQLNVAAAKLARNAREIAGLPAFIAGSIGPTGKLLSPLGDFTESQLGEAFKEQMEALLAGGVDLFIIETMSSLEETAIAVRTARKLAKLPVIAQFSFSVEGHTLFGLTPEDIPRFVVDLKEEAPDIVGINCGAGPGPVFDCLLRMVNAVKEKGLTRVLQSNPLMFSCLPNAGQPSLTAGRYQFMSHPDYCASYVEPYVRAGARLIGGCCGTTPDHIKAMRCSLNKYIEGTKQSFVAAAIEPGLDRRDSVHERVPSSGSNAGVGLLKDASEPDLSTTNASPSLASRLSLIKSNPQANDFFISVELDPPKGSVMRKLLKAAQSLYQAGADAINVGDSPMARVRMSSLATCHLIGQEVGVETIIHFTTRDRNLMGIQADLLGCQALGINNVLALTGDPPVLGNYAHATAVYDVDSIGLIKIISKLNDGLDIAGNSIGSATKFSIGCAVNPTHENRKQERERFRRKIEAGAHFAMTQPIYQASDLTNFLEEFGSCPIPILVGILPLHSFKHAQYLHNEVPGITIPEYVRTVMEQAGEQGQSAGLSLAEELLKAVKHLCQGAYLIPSFGRYDDMCNLVATIKQSKSLSAK